MLKDKNTMFSDDQAVTTTAASTSYLDQLAAGNAVAPGIWLDVRVKTTFTGQGSTTLTIALECDDNTSFSSAKTLFTTAALDESVLVAGYHIRVKVPIGAERYLRMTYTVGSGPMTAGKIDASMQMDVDITVED